MFVNFDMDGKFVSHWNIFSHLVLSMCVIARRSAIVTGILIVFLSLKSKINSIPTNQLLKRFPITSSIEY